MSTWKRIVLVNVAGLVGIAVSLFVLPQQIRFWVWASVSVVVLALLNYAFLRPRQPATIARKRGARVIVGLGLVLLLLDLLWRRFSH
jgi:hypothetical protein